MIGTLRRRVGAERIGRLSPICTTKERFAFTASSSRPYSGSTAVREEDVSDKAGDEMRASKDVVGERGGGTGMGEGVR